MPNGFTTAVFVAIDKDTEPQVFSYIVNFGDEIEPPDGYKLGDQADFDKAVRATERKRKKAIEAFDKAEEKAEKANDVRTNVAYEALIKLGLNPTEAAAVLALPEPPKESK